MISVIMSVFNESNNELKESINSIIEQTYTKFHFIIVDDNPQSKRIKQFLLKFSKKDSRIYLIFNKINLGAALSRNKGIKHSKDPFIAIMDADDIALKNRLMLQYKFLKANNLDFVFPNYRTITFNGKIIHHQMYSIKSITNQNIIYYIFSHLSDIAMNSGWFIRRNVFKELHGYRNVISEDYDFVSRAIIVGYKLGYQNKILMIKRYRCNSIMRKHALGIYIISRYIQRFMNKSSGPRIFKSKAFNKYLSHKVTKKVGLKFNRFLITCHNVKYNFTIISFLKMLYYLFSTKFAFGFLVNHFVIEFRTKRFISING